MQQTGQNIESEYTIFALMPGKVLTLVKQVMLRNRSPNSRASTGTSDRTGTRLPTCPLKLFTKWCPQPHQCTREAVRSGIEEPCERLSIERIDLLRLHWWSSDHPGFQSESVEENRLSGDYRVEIEAEAVISAEAEAETAR